MKLFKKLFLIGTSLLLALSVGASLNNAHANSQTNKLPHYMRNMWYGNMSEDGLKSIKLYGSPYINNGYNHLHIKHITRYGHKYDLDVPDADPIEVWYSHGHLNGLESGTARIHLYAHHNKRHNKSGNKYTWQLMNLTNKKRYLKGFAIDDGVVDPGFPNVKNPSKYGNGFAPKHYKFRKGTLFENDPVRTYGYKYEGHNMWKFLGYVTY